MKAKKHYNYNDIAEYLEANGQKEAADRLRAEFACRERGLCRKIMNYLKEKWNPLNIFLKIGLTFLFYAGTVLFCEYWYRYGFLKGTIDTIGIIALLGGAVLTIGGLITHFERK